MENIYQHFRKEEKDFIDLAVDWVERAESRYSPYLTPFLDPRQNYIVQSLVGQDNDLSYHSCGGIKNSERNRMIITPNYYEPVFDDFEISLLEINYPSKFQELTHSQILGTLMGSGIKRETIGDIITDGDRWQIVTDQKISSFLLTQIDRIGKAKVKLYATDFSEILEIKDEWRKKTIVSSSLRLDTIISSSLNLSRKKAKALIEANRVKINWSNITTPNEEVDIKDIISARGFGRIQLVEIYSKTKKDKYLLEIAVLKSDN